MTTSTIRPNARYNRETETTPIMNTGVRAYDCKHYDTCLMGAALVDMDTMPCDGCTRYRHDDQMSLKDMMSFVHIAAHILEVDESAFFSRRV